jgi:hypothetical protein
MWLTTIPGRGPAALCVPPRATFHRTRGTRGAGQSADQQLDPSGRARSSRFELQGARVLTRRCVRAVV